MKKVLMLKLKTIKKLGNIINIQNDGDKNQENQVG